MLVLLWKALKMLIITLVAEPTIFGSHNLNMVYELVKVFDKPFGVVLNKCFDGENPSEKFCLEKDIKILGKNTI